MRTHRGLSIAVVLVSLVLAAVVVRTHVAEAQQPVADWTFMVYLDGDNNIEGDAIADFLEMAEVGSTTDLNIIVQLDLLGGPNTRRFRVTQGMAPSEVDALEPIGEANMGDPQTLVDFVQWAATNYPAERYALVLWDHGGGWRAGPLEPTLQFKDVCWDWQ